MKLSYGEAIELTDRLLSLPLSMKDYDELSINSEKLYNQNLASGDTVMKINKILNK